MRSLWVLVLLLTGTAAWAAEPATPVTFGDRLHAKFQHPRCLICHQFNTYQRQGLTYTTHRSRYLCIQCHRADVVGMPPETVWIAPTNMDYTGFSAAATCKLIKQRMGVDPDGKKLAHHLLTDGRILWALESGMTPAGQRPPVPGGYAEFKRDIEAWVQDGMRCE